MKKSPIERENYQNSYECTVFTDVRTFLTLRLFEKIGVILKFSQKSLNFVVFYRRHGSIRAEIEVLRKIWSVLRTI